MGAGPVGSPARRCIWRSAAVVHANHVVGQVRRAVGHVHARPGRGTPGSTATRSGVTCAARAIASRTACTCPSLMMAPKYRTVRRTAAPW